VDKLNIQRREKEKDLRHIREALAPVTVTLYQICNMSPAHVQLLLKVEIEKLDCALSKRATRPYIYMVIQARMRTYSSMYRSG